MEQNVEETTVRHVAWRSKSLSKWRASKVSLLVVLLASVGAMVVTAHWRALSAEAFCFDDDMYLTDNPLVQNPSWLSLRRFFREVLEPSTVDGYYQPLTMTSLMSDYALGGRPDNLRPFHRTSLALHVANSALVIVLLYLLFDRVWVAAGVGLLFGVHPMAVETICWVSDRKTLLGAFFALWCLVLYVRYAGKSDWRLWVGCTTTYVLAMMSKPTSLPLPVLMLLMDYWPLRRLKQRVFLEKLHLFVVGGVLAMITYTSQSRAAVAVLPGKHDLLRLARIICRNIIFYHWKMVWPANLSSFYGSSESLEFSDPIVLMGIIGTCSLIVVAVVSLRWTRAALTSSLFFFVAILPTMGVIRFTTVIASDKYAYLPSLGLLMLLASFICWFCGTNGVTHAAPRKVMVAMIVLILGGVETVATRRYSACWRDTVTLFEHMLVLNPEAAPVHNTLGSALQSRGKLDEAIFHYSRALQIDPVDPIAHRNLGSALQLQGKLDQAIECYRRALQIKPDEAKTHYNLACALSGMGKTDEAIIQYYQALQIRPDYADAENNLGNTLSSQGKIKEAIAHYGQAIRINPSHARAHNNLGNILQSQGHASQAVTHYRKALRIKPDDPEVHYNLGNALKSQGKLDEAIAHYHHTLQINNDDAKTHNNLGNTLALLGKFEEAVNHYRRALEINPDYADVHLNLARILRSQGKLNEAVRHYRQSLRCAPRHAKAHYELGLVLSTMNRADMALGHFQEALRLKPDYPAPLNDMAKILTVHCDPKVRDVDRAVRLAEHAAELTKYQDAFVLDTLAMAYAAAGQFDRAVTTAELAIKLASATPNHALAKHLRDLLELYRQGGS